MTHDGHLTLDQAKAGYKSIAHHFDAIDKDKRGYITEDDIRAYHKTQRTLHHQASSTARENAEQLVRRVGLQEGVDRGGHRRRRYPPSAGSSRPSVARRYTPPRSRPMNCSAARIGSGTVSRPASVCAASHSPNIRRNMPGPLS